ncbi:hypothetical protein JYU14_02600 [Simkania negevensis]|uniref:Tetratricopeptide repeat protein n=1 Tax=Simkania negevensis TaxID=83561 RepID=A0ABS3ATI5_9BACT|nr:hypothetical protein [Simkania negevensis]
MADDFNEILEDIEESEFDSTRKGKIVDLSKPPKNPIYVIIAILVILLLATGGWLLYRWTRTDEDIVRKNTRNRDYISTIFTKEQSIIQNPTSSAADLKYAVTRLTEITSTPLRISPTPQAPYIKERNLAAMIALEGLLRLQLEGGLDQDRDKAFYEDVLVRIGSIELEYHDLGLIQQTPLLKAAPVLRKLRYEESLGNRSSPIVLSRLNNQLNEVRQSESFTIVPMALTLGKWYRYTNQLVNADHCFQIARRYIDGYELDHVYYKGIEPQHLTPLWNEYAASLEALAESAFKGHFYRQARSYLTRIFYTPSERGKTLFFAGPTQILASNAQEIDAVNQTITNVNNDIAIIKEAIQTPTTLPSFPLFNKRDVNLTIDWPAFLSILSPRSTESNPKQLPTAQKKIWQRLTKRLKDQIDTHKDASWMTREDKREIIHTLNAWIEDPGFWQTVACLTEDLCEKIRTNQKQEPEKFSFAKHQSINRDLIDTVFSGAITNQYVLDDGNRLNDRLRPTQRDHLIVLYQEGIRRPDISPTDKEHYKAALEEIYTDRHSPSLKDYSYMLQEAALTLKKRIKANESAFEKQRDIMVSLAEVIKNLESQPIINSERLSQLYNESAIAKNRQHQAKIEHDNAQQQLKKLDNNIEGLTLHFFELLKNKEVRLAELVNRQNALQEKNLSRRKFLLTQLDQQIHLHDKYLSMLKSVRQKEGDVSLQQIRKKQVEVNKKIESLHQKIASLTGNEREEREIELMQVETLRHSLVSQYDAIFAPLRDIVQQIAIQEEEIVQAREALLSAREEIRQLIGTPSKPGEIARKSKKRTELILAQSNQIINTPKLNDQIFSLNDEIIQAQARLSLLLQKEEIALETINTFFSHSNANLLLKEDFAPLYRYLTRQKTLLDQYRAIWQHRSLLQDIEQQQMLIVENLNLINQALDTSYILSEQATYDIGRYARSLIKAKNRYERDKRLLKQVETFPILKEVLDQPSGTGFMLDTVALYQLEQEIGFEISAYQNAFIERNALVEELQEAISRKNKLQQEEAEATRNRDNIKLEALAPQIAIETNWITDTTRKQIQINEKLQRLAGKYKEKLGRIEEYRRKIPNKVVMIEDKMAEINRLLSKSDHDIMETTRNLFFTEDPPSFQKTTLSLSDLIDLDNLIDKEHSLISRLKDVRELKKKENFYKAKALWLIGKSYYDQSQLTNFADLQTSSSIPQEMIDIEINLGGMLFREFDVDYIYTNQAFGDITEKDENYANYKAWIDFLLNNALRVFRIEMEKYTPSLAVGTDATYVIAEELQKHDLNSYIAKARFLTGKIHMRKAKEFLKTTKDEPKSNPLFMQEMSLAHNAFSLFLEFIQSPYIKNKPLNTYRFGSEEFPLRLRHSISYTDEAKVYLGVIASLRGDYHSSNNEYKQLLTSLHNQIADPSLPIGQIIPVASLVEYEFNVNISPYYTSLLSLSPLTHEVLFRMAKNYQTLADVEYAQALTKSAIFSSKYTDTIDAFRQYAEEAIAYYSQLILTQAYSPYRKAAQFQRALIARKLGNYRMARNDLIAILGSSTNRGSSMDPAAITEKGDLPGDLDPSYSYIALELGKTLFETHDYAAAEKAFLDAEQASELNEYVIKAKINYADTLIQRRHWLKADLYLTKLLQEAQSTPEPLRSLFPPDLLINFGIAKKEMFNFTDATQAFEQVLSIAPPELRTLRGLDLSNPYGVRILETDYRDAIRPLALATFYKGEILQTEKKYPQAKHAFRQAEELFSLLPWQEDRILREYTRQNYEVYRNNYILKTRWEIFKTDLLSLLDATFARYEKELALQTPRGSTLPPQQILLNINQALLHAREEAEPYREMLAKITQFKNREEKKLPEVAIKEQILAKRAEDKQAGKRQAKVYAALNNIFTATSDYQNIGGDKAIPLISTQFSQETLEDKLLNEFAFEYGQSLNLTEADRSNMSSKESNLENLTNIQNSQEKLASFRPQLILWLEKKMRATGLDDRFIPVSPQKGTIEEIDLYRASILSSLDTKYDYDALTQLANNYLEASRVIPNRIKNPEAIWQILEIAALTAQYRQDWESAVTYFHYLLSPEQKQFFLLSDKSDLYRAELGLARSLLSRSQEIFASIPFTFDAGKREEIDSQAREYQSEAEALLQNLTQLPGSGTAATTTRILANELLSLS